MFYFFKRKCNKKKCGCPTTALYNISKFRKPCMSCQMPYSFSWRSVQLKIEFLIKLQPQ